AHGNLASNDVLHRLRILHAFGRVENLQSNHVAVFVIIQNDTGLVFVTFLDWHVAEQNSQYVHFRVIGYFHLFLQYLLILLVRYTVTTTAGLIVSSTIARSRNSLPLPKSICD